MSDLQNKNELDDIAKDVRDFYSKDSFDFSTVDGWKEFLNERSVIGTGVDADGLQRRDFKYYIVKTAGLNVTATPSQIPIYVRTAGGSLVFPSGNLYVMHPSPGEGYKVSQFNLGPPSVEAVLHITVGSESGDLEWGIIYYIYLLTEDIPLKDEFAKRAKEEVKEVVKDARKLVKRGFNLLSYGGASVMVRVVTDSNAPWDYILPQKTISDKSMEQLDNFIENTEKYIGFWD